MPGRTEAHASADSLRQMALGKTADAHARRHLPACRRCRQELAALETLAAIRARGRRPSRCPDAADLVRLGEGAEPALAGDGWLRAHVAVCAGCAAALTTLSLAARAAGEPPGPVAPGPGIALVHRLAALLRLEMPPSLAFAPRSGSAALPGFAAAMAEYRAGRFARARELLTRAAAAGEQAAELDFYLGCCLLRAGRPGEGAIRLAAAVRRRPALGSYRFYLAQAAAAAGDGDDALRELRRAARLPGPHRATARRVLAAAAAGGR